MKNENSTATSTTAKPKVKKVKLDLVHNSAEFVKVVQAECRSWQYDVRKVMQRLNCNYSQASTVVALAQIADAQPSRKAA